uniref:Methyltransf_11 domain-containing protein n=1 Tax=Globodera pallida TaxID=36090 RepID=A0A183CJA1_GLOPA
MDGGRTPRHIYVTFLLLFFAFSTLVVKRSNASGVAPMEKIVSSSLDANWATRPLSPPMASPEAELDTALTHAGALLAPHDGGLALLRFALALRLHSPRVHLHRQIARDVLRRGTPEGLPAQFKHFFELNGAVGFDVAQLNALSTAALLEAAKQRSPSVVYSVDHIYPSVQSVGPSAGVSIADDVVVAVLYADIGALDDKFRALHERFVHLATGGQLIYVLRHFDNNDQAKNFLDAVSLSGYGVELAIKSTEYKAIDDSNEQKTEEASHDVHGFNFSRLREKNEHLRDNLRQFQLHLAELDELSPLKQWEIADIDIQAAQRVMDATPEEALGQLTDLSQNFPIRARSLVQTKVRQSFRDE